MTTKPLNPLGRASWALSALLALSIAACSSKERSDLVLVDVDLTEVPSASSLTMAMLTATTQTLLREQIVATPPLQNGVAKIGLAQTAGMAGDIVVRVIASDGSGVIGQGKSVPVTIVPGRNAGPVAVRVTKADSMIPDGGSPLPGTLDAGTPDGAQDALDARMDALGQSLDTGSGGDADSPPGLPDGLAAADGSTDVPTFVDLPASDVLPSTDLPPSSDVVPPVDVATASWDVAADAPADVVPPDASNILGTLGACQKYVHYPNSPDTCASGSEQEKVLLSSTAFTPDGRYLITAANNSWVKLWKVVEGGLEDTKIVLTGESYRVTATISPAGDLLAVASPSGNIALYDLKETIAQGSGMQVGTLEASKLAKPAEWDNHQAFFTTDGKQVVVLYTAANAIIQSGGSVAVWELVTRSLLREFPFEATTRAFTVSNASVSGPLWTVLGTSESVPDDAGTRDQTTVALLDASGSATVKPTFIVPGRINRAAFSADNRTLAVGTTDGQISLWDLSTVNDIQRLGSPLLPGGTRDSVYGLGFSWDGRFLAAGSWVYNGASSLWLFNLQTRAIVKRDIEYEPRAFGFAPDGTTWAYGLGGCGFLYFCQ